MPGVVGKVTIITEMDRLKTVDLAYIAGLFDGEGCVYIGVMKRQKQYFLRAELVNTYADVLRDIQALLGGRINRHIHLSAKHRDTFTLTWYANQAKLFLETVLPYLRIKREQALLGIAFQSEMKGVGVKIGIEGKAAQHEYKQKMSKLNFTGFITA